MRMVVADDHPFVRAGIEAVLRGSRYEVAAMASTGEEALVAIERYDPAICLLDVRMPNGGGVEVLELLRQRADRRAVVLLTAELADRALVRALRLGVNGIVLKDAAADQLVACLDTVTSGGRAIPAELVERALNATLNPAEGHPFDALAPRERQIAEQVARSMRNRQIAAALGMSEGTVKVYLHGIYQKLGIGSRTELALIANAYSAPVRDT